MMSLQKAVICLVGLIFVLGSTSASAIQKQKRMRYNSSEVAIVNRVVSVVIGDVAYEITDSTKRGEKKGDGIIDFANFIKKIEEADNGMESQIPRNARFPLTVKLIYFQSGDELSSYSSLTREEWFSGFYGKVAECYDSNGRLVSPKGGGWKTYSVGAEFMKNLQRMYNEYR